MANDVEIKVGADTTNLQRSVNKINASLKGLEDSAKKNTAGMRSLGDMMRFSAAGIAITGLVKLLGSAYDEAKRLGSSANDAQKAFVALGDKASMFKTAYLQVAAEWAGTLAQKLGLVNLEQEKINLKQEEDIKQKKELRELQKKTAESTSRSISGERTGSTLENLEEEERFMLATQGNENKELYASFEKKRNEVATAIYNDSMHTIQGISDTLENPSPEIESIKSSFRKVKDDWANKTQSDLMNILGEMTMTDAGLQKTIGQISKLNLEQSSRDLIVKTIETSYKTAMDSMVTKVISKSNKNLVAQSSVLGSIAGAPVQSFNQSQQTEDVIEKVDVSAVYDRFVKSVLSTTSVLNPTPTPEIARSAKYTADALSSQIELDKLKKEELNIQEKINILTKEESKINEKATSDSFRLDGYKNELNFRQGNTGKLTGKDAMWNDEKIANLQFEILRLEKDTNEELIKKTKIKKELSDLEKKSRDHVERSYQAQKILNGYKEKEEDKLKNLQNEQKKLLNMSRDVLYNEDERLGFLEKAAALEKEITEEKKNQQSRRAEKTAEGLAKYGYTVNDEGKIINKRGNIMSVGDVARVISLRKKDKFETEKITGKDKDDNKKTREEKMVNCLVSIADALVAQKTTK